MKLYNGFLFVLLLLFGGKVCASGDEKVIRDADELLQRAKFSKHVEKELANKRVNLALVARLGRPQEQLPEGVVFTHVAIAVYSATAAADGVTYPGYVFYNLYQSSKVPSRSNLVTDSAFQFFSAASAMKAGIIIPNLGLQKSLLRLLTSENYAALHRQPYSVIANPLTLDYQNCTEFVADLITAAIYETVNPRQIKANQHAYFEPTELQMSQLKITLASIFSSGISVSDHNGPIKIATFQSITNYLQRHRALQERFVLCGEGERC